MKHGVCAPEHGAGIDLRCKVVDKGLVFVAVKFLEHIALVFDALQISAPVEQVVAAQKRGEGCFSVRALRKHAVAPQGVLLELLKKGRRAGPAAAALHSLLIHRVNHQKNQVFCHGNNSFGRDI